MGTPNWRRRIVTLAPLTAAAALTVTVGAQAVQEIGNDMPNDDAPAGRPWPGTNRPAVEARVSAEAVVLYGDTPAAASALTAVSTACPSAR